VATKSSAEPFAAKPRGFLAGIEDVVELLGRELLQLARVTLGFVFFLDGWRVRKSRSDTKRYEGHGYLIWGLALWMFAVPELYGSIKHENGHIPTLSNTVGNLINAHNWVSVFVVGVLFFGAAHIAQVQVPKRRRARKQHIQVVERSILAERSDREPTRGGADEPSRPLQEEVVPAGQPQDEQARGTAVRRPEQLVGGRWTLTGAESGRSASAGDDAVLPVYTSYEAWAIALTIVAFVVPAYLVHADKQTVGESGYSVLFFFLFALPGLLAKGHDALAPFPGLFTTVLDLEKRSPPLAVIFGAGLIYLAIHLTFYPFPSILPDIQGLNHYCHPKGLPSPGLCIKP
jgi:hypothetical protein